MLLYVSELWLHTLSAIGTLSHTPTFLFFPSLQLSDTLMSPRPETQNGSAHLFTSGQCNSKLNNMSIKELVSELRDSFMSTDFDRVEKTLEAREARLKAEVEDMKREIGSLKEQINLEMLKKISAEFALNRVKQKLCKRNGNANNGLGLDCEVVKVEVGCERSELGCGVGEVEGEKVEALEVKKKPVGELKSENMEEFCEEEKRVNGSINEGGSVPFKKNGDVVGASARGKLGMLGVIYIEDSDEDLGNTQATLDRKETTLCTVKDDRHQSSSSQKNLPTGQDETPFGTVKRKSVSSFKLGTNITVLDGSDSDTSSSSFISSSSSDSEFDVDSLPLTSNKKKKADVDYLGLNSSQR